MAANAKKPVISGQHSVFLTGYIYIYIIRCQKQSELKDCLLLFCPEH